MLTSNGDRWHSVGHAGERLIRAGETGREFVGDDSLDCDTEAAMHGREDERHQRRVSPVGEHVLVMTWYLEPQRSRQAGSVRRHAPPRYLADMSDDRATDA